MTIAKIKDWELNVKSNAEFVKKGVDTAHLRICTTGGVIHVSGKLVFLGGKVDSSIDAEVINILKNVDRCIRSITGVRDVKYSLTGWARVGGMWVRTAVQKG